ncbi:GNAT family N-acetyltransferase [Streptococcus canis]|nr:GNAT family N-acetyltransferase [Streptococcus canis]
MSYSSIINSKEVILHRLFVKSMLKHQGIGSKLLYHAEKHLTLVGI